MSLTARQRARQRAATKRLVRGSGLKVVAATFGLAPSTVALYVAGESTRADSLRRIDRAFEELGENLGLVAPLPPMRRRELTPLPGEPRLRVVRPDGPEPLGSVLGRVMAEFAPGDDEEAAS